MCGSVVVVVVLYNLICAGNLRVTKRLEGVDNH